MSRLVARRCAESEALSRSPTVTSSTGCSATLPYEQASSQAATLWSPRTAPLCPAHMRVIVRGLSGKRQRSYSSLLKLETDIKSKLTAVGPGDATSLVLARGAFISRMRQALSRADWHGPARRPAARSGCLRGTGPSRGRLRFRPCRATSSAIGVSATSARATAGAGAAAAAKQLESAARVATRVASEAKSSSLSDMASSGITLD